MSPSATVVWKKYISLGEGSTINKGCVINVGSLTTGRNFSLGFNSCILGGATIGDNVMTGPNVTIVGGNHGIKLNGVPMNKQPCSGEGVIIMNDVWIGANSVILDKSYIEDHCVIGASSVVRSKIESKSIAVGSPAKTIKYRE